MRVMKGSLDMDQNIISLVYKTDGVAGQVRSPGCHGYQVRSPGCHGNLPKYESLTGYTCVHFKELVFDFCLTQIFIAL